MVDKNKVRRELYKNRQRLQEHSNTQSLEGLYFDGRKDITILLKKNRRIKKQEEHISIVKEPGSTYFRHLC